jgi:hypothetical protein
VKVTVVHFNYVGLFGTRTVVEEDFYFNLAWQSVHVYDFSGENVHTPIIISTNICWIVGCIKSQLNLSFTVKMLIHT